MAMIFPVTGSIFRTGEAAPGDPLVVLGSNSSTSKQTKAAMKVAEAQRTELIGMIDLRSVGSRNGLQAIDS
jgi:hypothetical protein